RVNVLLGDRRRRVRAGQRIPADRREEHDRDQPDHPDPPGHGPRALPAGDERPGDPSAGPANPHAGAVRPWTARIAVAARSGGVHLEWGGNAGHLLTVRSAARLRQGGTSTHTAVIGTEVIGTEVIGTEAIGTEGIGTERRVTSAGG